MYKFRLIPLTLILLLTTGFPSNRGEGAINEKSQKMNRLAHESSPYLLQHADNPVDWYPWSEEAFNKARELNRPIFLSIGYSTCHWCHVMEYESFEDEQVAQLLNENFIAIKVDREELPEIDHVYMAVCQAMTGRGGWPLTIIMTPDKEPFFAGTYFPKEGRSGRMGMLELLPAIADAWSTRRDELTKSISRIKAHLEQINRKTQGEFLTRAVLTNGFDQFKARYDHNHGGFGSNPKFPAPHNLIFLLRYYHMTKDKAALEMVETTLQHMRQGGIFDHVGFGFHRYSTDREWLVPHFEKMLYDQALLALAYTETYQITKNNFYARTAQEIFTYVLRDMTDPKGGFYSAEDADSEGEEGKFYLWEISEIESILGLSDAKLIAAAFELTKNGNFRNESTREYSGHNIFYQNKPQNEIAKEFDLSLEELETRLESARQKLFKVREQRIHPLKDDKILTDWNGIMIAALAKAGLVFDKPEYVKAAEKAADFILTELRSEDGRLLKRYRKGQAGLNAHLDDYAFLVWGLLELYDATYKLKYLDQAVAITDIMVKDFWDENVGGFFLGSNQAETLIVRSKTGYDGAIPSGNSVATMNLQKLTRLTGNVSYAEMVDKTIRIFSNEIQKSPTGFSHMLTAFLFESDDPKEVVLVGSGNDIRTVKALERIQADYFPNKVIIFKNTDDSTKYLSTLAEWTNFHSVLDNKPTFYICRNFACNQPTTDLTQAVMLLHE